MQIDLTLLRANSTGCTKLALTVLLASLWPVVPAQAQSPGITTQGNTGGLVIPYADVLAPGAFDHQHGRDQKNRNGYPYFMDWYL